MRPSALPKLSLQLRDATPGGRRTRLLTGQLGLGGRQFPSELLSAGRRSQEDGTVLAVRGSHPLTAHHAAALSALRAADDVGGDAVVFTVLDKGHHVVAPESEIPTVEVFPALLL